MSDAIRIKCWSCHEGMTLFEHGNADGLCPCCGVEVDLADYLEEAIQQNIQLEAEAQALRDEVAALRARVVVPERMEYDGTLTGQEHRDNRRYVNGWNDALSRLNGKAVSEGLLRRIVTPALTSSDAQDRIDALEQLRDLLGEGKEVGDDM